MSERVTQAQVADIFRRFLKAAGLKEAASYTDVGGYALEHQHGGKYRVIVYRENGGEGNPFGFTSRTASEMWHTLDFATQAIHVSKENHVR